MDDTPIPEYLVDMLKEAGHVDKDGKPVDDFFDPDEDDTFGTQRQRDRIAQEVTYTCDTHRSSLRVSRFGNLKKEGPWRYQHERTANPHQLAADKRREKSMSWPEVHAFSAPQTDKIWQ